jgi:hypothetical protein
VSAQQRLVETTNHDAVLGLRAALAPWRRLDVAALLAEMAIGVVKIKALFDERGLIRLEVLTPTAPWLVVMTHGAVRLSPQQGPSIEYEYADDGVIGSPLDLLEHPAMVRGCANAAIADVVAALKLCAC